ncbi:hypothetical protein [Rhizobium sp. NFR12]|uniref:hypothetical protein n=1 Tax=Rhizobium sp. NFR12 TaxID=1566261 RepID=UPI001114F601|nr:hypothetical protein [Rhizobium sp. NFR12]
MLHEVNDDKIHSAIVPQRGNLKNIRVNSNRQKTLWRLLLLVISPPEYGAGGDHDKEADHASSSAWRLSCKP